MMMYLTTMCSYIRSRGNTRNNVCGNTMESYGSVCAMCQKERSESWSEIIDQPIRLKDVIRRNYWLLYTYPPFFPTTTLSYYSFQRQLVYFIRQHKSTAYIGSYYTRDWAGRTVHGMGGAHEKENGHSTTTPHCRLVLSNIRTYIYTAVCTLEEKT